MGSVTSGDMEDGLSPCCYCDKFTSAEMTELEIDIDGHQKTLKAYVILTLSHELILGKSWMEKEDVIYHARERCMDIREALVNSHPLRVWEEGFQKESSKLNQKSANVACLSAGVFWPQ